MGWQQQQEGEALRSWWRGSVQRPAEAGDWSMSRRREKSHVANQRMLKRDGEIWP